MSAVRVLLLPGWQDSGPGHWQSRWQARHGFERLQQDDWWWPKRGDWMTRLQDSLLADDRPTVLVAHSLGCHLVAAWAAHARQVAPQHLGRVAAALLVAPPDLARADAPPQLQAWAPAAHAAQTALPALAFPSTLVLSADDPFSDAACSLRTGADWGCEIVSLGAAGHVNGDSGLGDWPEGLALLQALMRRAGIGDAPATA